MTSKEAATTFVRQNELVFPSSCTSMLKKDDMLLSQFANFCVYVCKNNPDDSH